MSGEEQIVLIGYGKRYHKASYFHFHGEEILHTVCGFNSLEHDMIVYPRERLFLLGPGLKPCKRCFNEKYCDVCGEKMPGLRWTRVNGKPYRACEICIGDNNVPQHQATH